MDHVVNNHHEIKSGRNLHQMIRSIYFEQGTLAVIDLHGYCLYEANKEIGLELKKRYD